MNSVEDVYNDNELFETLWGSEGDVLTYTKKIIQTLGLAKGVWSLSGSRNAIRVVRL